MIAESILSGDDDQKSALKLLFHLLCLAKRKDDAPSLNFLYSKYQVRLV